jgi:hypothetical protein
MLVKRLKESRDFDVRVVIDEVPDGALQDRKKVL